jgi:hypothetical protein
VTASKTCVVEPHGVGPIVAAPVLDHSVGRDPSCQPPRPRQQLRDRPARRVIGDHAMAPAQYRREPSAQLNHAIHMIAITKIGGDTPERVYSQRKIDEGNARTKPLWALNAGCPTPSTANSSWPPTEPEPHGSGRTPGTTHFQRGGVAPWPPGRSDTSLPDQDRNSQPWAASTRPVVLVAEDPMACAQVLCLAATSPEPYPNRLRALPGRCLINPAERQWAVTRLRTSQNRVPRRPPIPDDPP